MGSVAIALVGLALVCNITLLAAINAGRKNPGWSRRLWLACEAIGVAVTCIGSLLIALVTASTLGWELARRDLRLVLVTLVALAIAAAGGGLFAYVEYALTGRGGQLRADYRQSVWIGHQGLVRGDSSRTR